MDKQWVICSFKSIFQQTNKNSYASFLTHYIDKFVCHPYARRGYDINTVQKLLGRSDVRMMMIYTHVLYRGWLGVRSPMDVL
ncbi:MAG: tyrosine-type recombinase/integrase [Proteobacteria bacterium]|nr:tyrosine-type recombinase/integrase [Pseudomonadota bacterium]MBU1626547.1 tyrosine-type recombinase/integrase [bacterium]